MFVTEDTTRAAPEDLRRLYTEAVEAGARRVCVADTVGHATPNGARNVIRFIREVVDATGEDVKIDWHGHKDRGLAVINALAAAEAGADRLHGTAVGIGERVGNCPIDMLLVNMQLLGWIDRDLHRLPGVLPLRGGRRPGVPLPDNYPVVGKDAFRTGTGVHASAIIKARAARRGLAGRPRLLVDPGGPDRLPPGDRGRADERRVERRLLAPGARASRPRPSWSRRSSRRRRTRRATLEESEILEICTARGITPEPPRPRALP